MLIDKLSELSLDAQASFLAPVATYWVYCSFYGLLDYVQFDYFEKRRLHPSSEIKTRNKPSVLSVIRDVLAQQIVQITVQALIYYFSPPRPGPKFRLSEIVMLANYYKILLFADNFIVSILQVLLGFFIIDTWQYFWHRYMHQNRWLYRKIHSHHHRLFVPYAFGALYNHILEGLLLDTFGAGVAYELTGMSIRVGTIFFCISTMKTIDDHCGYKLDWNPFQFLFANNVEYHDIHHQPYGFTYNYSQPFFIHWDKLMGTFMSYKERDKRRNSATAKQLTNEIKNE